MDDVLTNIRLLLLTFPAVTNAVGLRVRPHKPDSADGNADAVVLDLPDADQFNCLSGEAIVNGDLIIRTRSTDKATAAAIAGVVHEELRDFSGAAGSGYLIQCERLEFSHFVVDDDDDDDDAVYQTESLYSIFYQS